MGKGVGIVLDNIIFYLQRSGGGSVYWSEIIKRVDKSVHNITYLEPKGEHNNIFYGSLRQTLTHPLLRESFGARALSFLSSLHRAPDPFIFHSSYYRVASDSRAINIVTIHDFMPEKFFRGLKRFVHSWRKRKAIKKADGIICVSSNTKDDLLSYYPEVSAKCMITIPLGISSDYFVIADPEASKLQVPSKSYILFVGRRSHYKNFDFVISVVKTLKEYKLMVAGEEWTKTELSVIADLNDRVELVTNPSNAAMNELYNRAFCLLYPSSYEGFGIPVVEAMAAGCPVVALNASSIPEVSGGAALLLDHLDVTSFASAIRKLEDHGVRNELIQQGLINASRYSWDRSVDQLMEFYMSVYNSVENRVSNS